MSAKPEESAVALIKQEINKQLGDAETMQSLLSTTFNGFEAPLMKRALLEGMLRGFTFTEFLNKDVFAIPYGQTYSLVTSIDRARKIGARSGIVGVDAPSPEEIARVKAVQQELLSDHRTKLDTITFDISSI